MSASLHEVGTVRPTILRTPGAILGNLAQNRYVVWQMVRREVSARYRGSVLGMLWSLVQPLMMLAVYSLVFGVVFKARWPELAGTAQQDSGLGFAVVLFAGLIVHTFLADCLSRAPQLVLSSPNFVKKLVFPLDILPWVLVISALVHATISLALLLVFRVAAFGDVPWTMLLLPVIWAPFVLLLVGLSWLLAAIGVFVRDLGQIIGVLLSVMLFVSPVFIPMAQIPDGLRAWLSLNPITVIVVATRDVVVWERLPDFGALGAYAGVSVLVAWFGHYAFARLRRAFADVL